MAATYYLYWATDEATPTNRGPRGPDSLASILIVSVDMETTHDPLASRTSGMLRWQFRMRSRLLTCGITKSGAGGFSVITLPHWDVKSGIVEVFSSQASALQRHAIIAERLRSAGWSIASYTR